MPALPNYNLGGGFQRIPIGGYWNQVAQQMAGPIFSPWGSTNEAGGRNMLAQQPSQLLVPPGPDGTTPGIIQNTGLPQAPAIPHPAIRPPVIPTTRPTVTTPLGGPAISPV